MVDPRSTVKGGISVRLLDLIAHRDYLPSLCGDIGNAFITANCLEKMYSRPGPEFEDRDDFQESALRPTVVKSRISGSVTLLDNRDVWMRAGIFCPAIRACHVVPT